MPTVAPDPRSGTTMTACRVSRLGEPSDVLELVVVPIPTPSSGQVLVRVRAAAANFSDALMCRGHYQVKPELPFTPGVELCGEILETGEGVAGFAVGDRVLGASVAGAFSDLALMPAGMTFAAPDSLDDAEAAALYTGHQTAWFALHRRAAIQSGDVLLVHAAAGGVGSAAVQLGKAAGATVIAVVGGADKRKVAASLGADVVVDRRTEDFVQVVNGLTGGKGADIVFDPVGGETYRRSTKCIAFEGRIVVVGFASGEIQSVALNHPLVKNYSVMGLHLGLYMQRQPELVHQCHEQLSQLAATGAVKPLVSERVPLIGMPSGLQRLADGLTTGRVVMVNAEAASST